MVAEYAKTLIEALNVDLDDIADPNLRRCIVGQLNMVQHLSAENARLREEIQKLKDDVARLEGEQGKPDIKPNGSGKTGDISSEKRRKNREKRKRR